MTKRGKIHSASEMFLRIHVGTATATDNTKYEMSLIASSQTPLIMNMKTRKYFSLPWEDIINLAVDNGIDEPENCIKIRSTKCPPHQKH